MKSIKFMKHPALVILLVLTTNLTRADFSFSGGGDIPDGNLAGMVSVGTVSGVSGSVTGMTLDLNVSGGFNGDLYAYLVAPNQTTTAALLGTPGGNFDQVGSGYNIRLVSSGATGGNIQSVTQTFGSQVTSDSYTYSPIVPFLSALGGYLAANGANGNWRLFIADQSAGGGQAVLAGWNLSFTTTSVPEPDQVAAISLLGLIGLMAGSYRHWGRVLGFKRA